MPKQDAEIVRCLVKATTAVENPFNRVTQKKRELLKNPTKIEEIVEKKFIDRN